MSLDFWSKAGALSWGVMKATDIAKEMLARATGQEAHPYLKSTAATALAVLAGAAFGDTPRERMLLASAVAGMAAVAHEANAALGGVALRGKTLVVERAVAVTHDRATQRGVPPLP